jgi:hypothetical protein
MTTTIPHPIIWPHQVLMWKTRSFNKTNVRRMK